MIAKTIIAAIAANIVDATSAPIIMPKTNASSTPSIAAIILNNYFSCILVSVRNNNHIP